MANFSPYRLISLFYMIEFDLQRFHNITQLLGQVRGRYHEDESEASLSEDQINMILEELEQLRELCENAKLQYSVLEIDRVLVSLNTFSFKINSFCRGFDTIERRIYDELKSVVFLSIPVGKADYYVNLALFGQRVADAFPSAIFDIEEAGKCFAFGRYTACVMHLQRVLEIGLKSYGKLLNVVTVTAQPSWQTILDKTGKEIRERDDKNITTKNWPSDQEKDFCHGVQSFLVPVKNAWRNPSMHAEAKYTEEIAKEIFEAVKSFMRNLAEHLDEKGKFRKKKLK